MKKKLGLATLALSTAMTLFIPAVASAHDSDDYRRGTESYQHNNSRNWERARERQRELERERERQRQQYRGRNYYQRGYYDRYGYWHQY